ncbi:LADA_0B01662g1_1 [Lachancea dasiensis]|uniref:LADA_0B01662g1_1 n=1 Tax=Lachancea dasiensis TaxID=1072105 RepID=A0A1G4IS15_9SACH|nr:LADA_0B01662g1_1 [Lachancea dasiensis]
MPPSSEHNLPPPSYEEVMSQTSTGYSSPNSLPVGHAQNAAYNSPPQRPPQRPPRPSSSSQIDHASSSSVSTANKLPWTYPRGYYCTKCGNSGYKIKNGQSCKRCWRKFAIPMPSEHVQVQYVEPIYRPSPIFPPSQGYSTYGSYYPSNRPLSYSSQPSAPPGVVFPPGDPRIGGFLCGECRGKGRVRFLLDKEICPTCRGVGRVF